MPGRNLEKVYVEHGFYHIYSRGVNKNLIYCDNEDYAVYLNLFKRYLSKSPVTDKKGREYPNLNDEIELLAFCLMPNHFHVLIYQNTQYALTQLFKYINTTYVMYFNKKYGRVGPLFQSRIRAKLITTDGYLDHISRYIHLNPAEYLTWQYSSLPYYLKKQNADWINPKRILNINNDNEQSYLQFLKDYEGQKKMWDEIKSELADC